MTFLASSPRSAAPHTPRVVLLGPTGSGKNIQAALLASKYNIVNGDIKIISLVIRSFVMTFFASFTMLMFICPVIPLMFQFLVASLSNRPLLTRASLELLASRTSTTAWWVSCGGVYRALCCRSLIPNLPCSSRFPSPVPPKRASVLARLCHPRLGPTRVPSDQGAGGTAGLCWFYTQQVCVTVTL